MGLIRGELIDIVEWNGGRPGVVAWRYHRPFDELKNGSKLIVREWQVALFVRGGQIIRECHAGTQTLQTGNVPVKSRLRGFRYGFRSPEKAEVHFVSTRRFTNLKWGTRRPVALNDPRMGPVMVAAHGSFSFRVVDPTAFLNQLVAGQPLVVAEQVAESIRGPLLRRLTSTLAAWSAHRPVLDVLNDAALADEVAAAVNRDLAEPGLEVCDIDIGGLTRPYVV
ncbi:SPFH domain-containing protein [Herbidospora mongoliensis]|uniref:SPFH domain-containing protein n=1 Tax=Herbidospora mongoliensis TaxID=688067 RepID=UPI00082F47A0|nr:SPFH domain-containing protein [Herbidospora mongoliensis]